MNVSSLTHGEAYHRNIRPPVYIPFQDYGLSPPVGGRGGRYICGHRERRGGVKLMETL
jgi:hypothetical protein